MLRSVSSSCDSHVLGKLGEAMSALVTLQNFWTVLSAGSVLGQQEVVSTVEVHR